MSNIKLGKIITDRTERDAVHIAIAPVEAAEMLRPGQDVGFGFDGADTVGPTSPRLIGVVDPFLPCMVEKGARFWLFMYPDTVKGLRHDWTHPAFDGDEGDDDAPSLSKMIAEDQGSEDADNAARIDDDDDDWCATQCNS